MWCIRVKLNRYYTNRCDCVCVLNCSSCPTLCDPMDYSPPVSSVHGIFQARVPEWVAFIFPTQGSNPGIPYCGQTLYPLSHQGSWYKSPTETDSKEPAKGVRFSPPPLAWEAFLVLGFKRARQKSDHTSSHALSGFTVWTSKNGNALTVFLP